VSALILIRDSCRQRTSAAGDEQYLSRRSPGGCAWGRGNPRSVQPRAVSAQSSISDGVSGWFRQLPARAFALPTGSSIIDIGCGSGWTSLFLGEAGYRVMGYDLVPANVELAKTRAERWSSSARFEVADMEALPPGEAADAALIFDSLHHTARQRETLCSAASRLRSGGWLLLGEASWLHRFPLRRALSDASAAGWSGA
jgi:2-polyprenyl-3-methyl-5-hydroxy-6-metoxy-1,4-benzoquinol methylase